MAITPKELQEKYDDIQLDKDEQIVADQMVEIIDKDIEYKFLDEKEKNINFNITNFECELYNDYQLNQRIEDGYSVKRIRVYLMQSYIKSGWDIIEYDKMYWKIKYDLYKLREESVNYLLE